MSILSDTIEWFSRPESWSGPAGIPVRLGEHLGYTALAVGIAALVAVPLGLYIGHTGRFHTLAVTFTGALRAIPTLGLLTFLVLLTGIGLTPPILALAILCIPPLLAGIYSGIEAVPRAVIDASRAQGMTEWQILSRVELPLASPIIVGGLRSAVLQVIATATVAAFVPLGGLGRYIIDGLAVRDLPRVMGGSLIVVALAFLIDMLFALVQRYAARVANPAARTPQPSRSLSPDIDVEVSHEAT
ncbi:osmoprotectant transport system permease protein [Bowdeniella nasicola]|uniref:Osmoprotectant transport system permease protein n=1 Tax=Bowdeniella nasicola TaxID=208480 RepID=A0A1H3WAG2_9ACTO|nr:ABC transporter permease [Bowdeniella nasicola]SDZ83258.1 osmoprotectant transport system permease protein [Bowdeniella nasicola]